VIEDQRGTGRAYLLSRLRAERPDLGRKVDLGEMSAYRAGLEAGMCVPRFTLAGHDPEVLAKAIRRNLPPEVIRAVVALLDDEKGAA